MESEATTALAASARSAQSSRNTRGWGGARKGAGRKPGPERTRRVAHRTRPRHERAVPTHITTRRIGSLSLRSQLLFRAIQAILGKASTKGFRLLQFNVLHDHLHLIVEAESNVALARGLQRLLSRIAQAVNTLAGRRGKLFRDRYFRRDLVTARQVRNALAYVLFNDRKHAGVALTEHHFEVDVYSSAPWFTGWHPRGLPPPCTESERPCPVVPPRSALARHAWKKYGLLRFDAPMWLH